LHAYLSLSFLGGVKFWVINQGAIAKDENNKVKSSHWYFETAVSLAGAV